jgi:A nuclease of the HNH/ENDO VII superfamily with conserved WHH
MGKSLKDGAARKQLDALEADTKAAAREKALDEAQAVLDIAGIADPTPISDLASGLISAARGDWIGAGLSLVSAIPYAGDAIAKTGKGAKLIAKLAAIEKRIADNAAKAKQIISNALKSDAAALRAKKAAAKAEKIDEALVKGCPIKGNEFGTHAPAKGWDGNPGDSAWDPAKGVTDPERLDEIKSVLGDKKLQFKDGYPDFTPYAHKVEVDGKLVPARVEIEMQGVNGPDFKAANEAMAKKLGVKDYDAPDGFTWHHNQDGVTMELIPSELHNNVPHSGGASLARNPDY